MFIAVVSVSLLVLFITSVAFVYLYRGLRKQLGLLVVRQHEDTIYTDDELGTYVANNVQTSLFSYSCT